MSTQAIRRLADKAAALATPIRTTDVDLYQSVRNELRMHHPDFGDHADYLANQIVRRLQRDEREAS